MKRYLIGFCNVLLVAPCLCIATEKRIADGKRLAFARDKGNCLACHVIAGGETPGNIGPPLVAMNQRYADRKMLRAKIWDATETNPNTSMPPFGRYKILTEQELDNVVEFVYSL